MDGLFKVTPDKKKAKSILQMVNTTLEMIDELDISMYSSNITKEYYDVIRELMSVIMLLDGYKTRGEGAHLKLIEYLQKNYTEVSEYEISLIDDLRITRNRIAYNGFFIQQDYIKRKLSDIIRVITKLKDIISPKM